MNRAKRLAVFAVKNAELVRPLERANLLDDAAHFLSGDEADLCRSTAAFIRHAEDHQLKLYELFSSK